MNGRSGETLTYTADGKLLTTAGTSTLPANPNPSATAGTPPAPVSGTAASTGTRYYDAVGNLVGLTDGTGTTVTIGSITAHVTPGGVQTATKTYSFAGKTVAQRTAAGGTVKLALIVSDGIGTAQTIIQGAVGTTPVIAQTRYTDPTGLSRGPTQAATGNGAYSTAGSGVLGVGSNAANPAGYGAVNGYIGGLADTISTLTHLGARDLDPVLGTFTSPDPVLKRGDANNFSPYVYGEADAINNADPSGFMILGPAIEDGGSWFGAGANVDRGPNVPVPYAPDFALPSVPFWKKPSFSSWTQPAAQAAVSPTSDDSSWLAGTGEYGEIMADVNRRGPAASAASALTAVSIPLGILVCVPGAVECAIGGGIVGLGTTAGANALEGKPALDGVDAVAAAAGTIPVCKGGICKWLGKGFAEGAGPLIKAGSSGGETAGKIFPQSVKRQTLLDNPDTCVFCHMVTDKPQVDHAIPRARGGNATIDHAQTTCAWCNASKGARDFPVNPPPGYLGMWPPRWW